MTADEIGFVFVVDGEGLALQSFLLAASLRLHNPNARIFACISEQTDRAGLPDLDRIYQQYGVESVPLPSGDEVWKQPYPHGNKILALALPRDVSISIFLDTDMIACRPFDPQGLPETGEIAVVPEGKPTWGFKNDRWDRAYAHFGLPVPEERVNLVRGRRRSFVPYFNAGYIAVPERETRQGLRFADAWKETAVDFDWNAPIAGKRPWLDQVALPLALYRYGWRYKVLSEEFNYSVSKRLPAEDRDPVFLHYHRMRFLAVCDQYHELREALRSGALGELAASLQSFLERVDAAPLDAVEAMTPEEAE